MLSMRILLTLGLFLTAFAISSTTYAQVRGLEEPSAGTQPEVSGVKTPSPTETKGLSPQPEPPGTVEKPSPTETKGLSPEPEPSGRVMR